MSRKKLILKFWWGKVTKVGDGLTYEHMYFVKEIAHVMEKSRLVYSLYSSNKEFLTRESFSLCPRPLTVTGRNFQISFRAIHTLAFLNGEELVQAMKVSDLKVLELPFEFNFRVN